MTANIDWYIASHDNPHFDIYYQMSKQIDNCVMTVISAGQWSWRT